jgi:hypothetical protein
MPAIPTVEIDDLDKNPAKLRIDDNADSICLTVLFSVADGSVALEAGVRLDSKRLDALEAEIRRIRESRGI